MPSGQDKSVTKVTFQVLVANISKNVALFLVLILIPRFYSTNDFGSFSLALAITTPFFAFALIGARVLRLTGPKNLSTTSIELALLITGALALVFSFLFTFVFYSGPDDNSYFGLLVLTVFSIGIYKWGDLFTELYAGEFQLAAQTNKLLIVSLLSGALLVLIAVFVGQSEFNFSFLLIGVAVYGILSASIYAFSTKKIRVQSKPRLSKALQLGFPLGLAGAIGTLMATTPQYFVAFYWGPELVGILAVILYAFSIADLFGAAFAQAWIHKIKELPDSVGQFRYAIKIGVYSSLIFIPISTLGIWIFSILLPLLFGKTFIITLSESIALIFAVSLLPLGHMISFALLVRIAYKQSLIIMTASALSVTVFSFLLIPNYALAGALWAVVSGITVRVVLPLLYNWKFIKVGKY